jgi:hypothetical protein
MLVKKSQPTYTVYATYVWLCREETEIETSVPTREETVVVNRSAPPGPVIPTLICEDVGKAIDWLCGAFGFTERLRAPGSDGKITPMRSLWLARALSCWTVSMWVRDSPRL